MITTEIPIKNYYYLLSYAWNLLSEKDSLNVDLEDSDNLNDLFGRIICRGTELLIKKGIKKSYTEIQEHTGSLRGKILLKESLPDLFNSNNKLCCEFDELTYDILENQIIFATIRSLLVENIDSGLKTSLRKVLSYSSGITKIKLHQTHFKKAKSVNKNGIYALLLNVCEVVYLSKLPNLNNGDVIFRDFINGEKELAKLFEMFTYNFYRTKLKGLGHVISAQSQICWGLKPMDQISREYLPKMRTDVIIESESQKLIIETKFYKQTFQSYFEKESIHSSNLYQLQSYLLNDKMTGEPLRRLGILIYPTISASSDLNYQFDDNTELQVRTVDLAQSWQEIERRMLSFIRP